MVKIREWRSEDKTDLAENLSNPNVLNNLRDGLPYPYTEKDAEDSFVFNYRGLGNKVGDIFKAYNVSFDRIDAYARSALSK